MDFLRRCAGQRCIPCRAGANAIAPLTGYLELRSTASSGKSKRAAPLLARLLRCIPREIVRRAGAALILGASVSACATTGHTWKEEVLLHDGQKIIAERSQSYGGRSEVGQGPPIRQLQISFELPATGKKVSWTSEYGEELGRTNFKLLALHIQGDTPYLVTVPNLCLSYNKWGRPNPPYVVFKHNGNSWNRIDLKELPAAFKTRNLLIDTLGEQAAIASHSFFSSTTVESMNRRLEQPEYRSILREELPKARIDEMCEERVFYKGYWVLPNDPIARKLIDQKRP